ncbi:hypothetical protein [Kitasatospora sp. NPDC057198]|uniref:hypothetical protein n=1 Tax=Kitasatospora sp. NPDC057198 TaxID=3346046 RepID=UPI003641960A
MTHVVPDGTLIESDRLAGVRENGNDLRFSQKHRAFEGKSEQALHIDTRMFNTLLRHVRALGERTAAELEQRRRTLQRVTLSPSRIGDIARTALVLNGTWK